jgi:hypothetical protein
MDALPIAEFRRLADIHPEREAGLFPLGGEVP